MNNKNKMSQHSIEQNLNLIYEAALESEHWKHCLSHIAICINAKSGMLGLDCLETGTHLSRISYGYEPDTVARLTAELRDKDLWTKALIDRNPDGFMLDTDLVPKHIYTQSEIFQELLKDYDIYHTIGAYVDKLGSTGVRIAFPRAKEQGEYNESERHYMNLILPHINRAIQLSKTLSQSEALSQSTHATSEKSERPLLLVSAEGYIVFSNESADALASAGSILEIRSGYLSVKNLQPGELSSALKSVCRDDDLLALEQPYAFSVLDNAGSPAMVRISRFQATGGVRSLNHTCGNMVYALVEILKPSCSKIALPRLITLFGMTKQEAEIALLICKGLSPLEIADQRCRSIETIRTQIKSITAKTEVKSINQLIYRLNNLIK